MNRVTRASRLVAFSLRAQKTVYRQDDVKRIDFAALGKALTTPSGTIDYRLLRDSKSEAHFVTNLLIEHSGRKAALQNAIVIMGPTVSLERKVSLEMLGAGGAASCPIFYLNYSQNPLEGLAPDTIGSALEAYNAASKYHIEQPRDFAAAMRDLLLRLGKRPTSRRCSLEVIGSLRCMENRRGRVPLHNVKAQGMDR
jgi:hypothetical protein